MSRRDTTVHKTWTQNRQATAVCDYCNRKNVPLQMCQTCQVNICRECISMGWLEGEPQHRVARGAVDDFKWHQWGKDKNLKRASSVKKTQPAVHANTPDPEPSDQPQPGPSQPLEPFGGSGGYRPADHSPQYPHNPYGHPMAMMYHPQQHIPTVQGQGLGPAGYPSTLGPYPGGSQMPQYPYSPFPYGMYNAPVGQPVYSNFAPQQTQYGVHSPYFPQLPPVLPGPMPYAGGQAPHNSQQLPDQSEHLQRPSQGSGHTATQAPPTTTSFSAQSSTDVNQNETPEILQQPSAPPGDTQRPPQVTNGQPVTQAPTSASEQPSAAARGSKRPRDVSEDLREGSSQHMNDPARQPTKKSRREDATQAAEPRPRIAASTARVTPKRSLQASEDDGQDAPGPSSDTKLRPASSTTQDTGLDPRDSSTPGVKPLHEVLENPQGDGGPSDSTSQPGLSSRRSSPDRQPSVEAVMKTRLDEDLDAVDVQPVPALPRPVRDLERSRQLSSQSDEEGNDQGSSAVRPTRGFPTGNQAEDDEMREAALILLSIRYGR